MIQRISVWVPVREQFVPVLSAVAQGLHRTAAIGTQIANMSFGANRVPFGIKCSDPTGAVDILPVCDALQFAKSRDVAIFAAVGNNDRGDRLVIDFPSNELEVQPVAGLDRFQNRWSEGTSRPGSQTDLEFPPPLLRALAGPARDVVSTFYTGRSWSPQYRCEDDQLPNDFLGLGYARCTGTSMATPYVAGIAALLRSVDPLRSSGNIINVMRQTAALAANPSEEIGHGRPDAFGAVQALLATTNRLTPLFAMQNETWNDHFYTVVPNMASAATLDTMARRDPPKDMQPYVTLGGTIDGYDTFPSWEASKGSAAATPRAQVWVFSTHRNPFGPSPSAQLRPIIRLSYTCAFDTLLPPKPMCIANGRALDHAYSTSPARAADLIVNERYLIDGIEGYLIPPETSPVPAGAVAMRIGSRNGDWALFPQTEFLNMFLQGFSIEPEVQGFAFLNSNGLRPNY